MLENINNIKQKNLKSLFPKATAIELDLLGRLLQFNPNKRINVLEALEHPYVADFHEQYAESEIECEKPIKLDINDKAKYSVKEYKQKLFDGLLKRKKEVRKKIVSMNLNTHSNNNNYINNQQQNVKNNQQQNLKVNQQQQNLKVNQQQQNLKVKKKKINNNSKYGK